MSLRARVADLEKARGVGTRGGLALISMMLGSDSRAEADIISIEVSVADGSRVRIDRLPTESIDDLERRANPRGCFRASPEPIYCNRTHFEHVDRG
jgi:hypothetical protein